MKRVAGFLNKWVNMGTERLTKKNIICFVSYVLIVLVSYVFIGASRWSYYSADDFSHANAVGVFGGNILELFKASIGYMIDTYKTWQGTYFSMFLQGFLSPLNGVGETQMAIVMMCNVVLFVLALILLVREICGVIGVESYLKAFLGLCALFSILGFKAWTEIFYWFSGAVSYSFPLSVAMFAIVLYIKNKNMGTYISACILTFFASGGTLEVAGASCFGILMILLVKGFKKLQRKDYIFFGIAVLGALINTVAPGNFARRDVIDDSGLHVGAALIYSVNQAISSLEYLLFQTPFLIILLLCVMIGFYVGGGKWFNKKMAFGLMGMCGVMPVVTCFPVYLAYSSSAGAGFPNRCEFVCVFVVVMAAMVVSVLLGVLIKENGCFVGYRELFVGFLFLCLVMPVLSENYRYTNTVVYRMYSNTAVGNFKKYHDSIMDIYREIEENESDDVIVESLPEAVADFECINNALTVDATYWANQALAKYYGKNSVALKQQE